jgi:hypothetical protein
MARTTRKNGVNVNKTDGTPKGALTLNKQTSSAVKEKSYQTTIERMQRDIALKTMEPSKLVKNAENELARINKIAALLREKNITPASEYKTLKDIYDRDIKHLTLEMFTEEGQLAMERFLAKCQGQITKEQEEIVSLWYAAKAHVSHNIVTRIRRLLEEKGQLKKTVEATVNNNVKVETV